MQVLSQPAAITTIILISFLIIVTYKFRRFYKREIIDYVAKEQEQVKEIKEIKFNHEFSKN